ncbi:hypothetical protein FB45DRAFT_871275 [Roridomyces roridus]|uniref:Hydrophobin n=1 Tax=Roridomyces roridus TaxID=1738132 RepID=A0AAD7BGJ8_9AGAR|nr:hypothetical protein FB45DRAFT_871275 [Roridomyces roridus]
MRLLSLLSLLFVSPLSLIGSAKGSPNALDGISLEARAPFQCSGQTTFCCDAFISTEGIVIFDLLLGKKVPPALQGGDIGIGCKVPAAGAVCAAPASLNTCCTNTLGVGVTVNCNPGEWRELGC